MPRSPLPFPAAAGAEGDVSGRGAGRRRHGAGGHEQIHQPGEPGCLPAPDRGAAGHRHVLHRLVLRLRGDFYQVHAGHLQGAADLAGGLALHGLRRPLPPAVGRYLRLRPGRRSAGAASSLPRSCGKPCRSSFCISFVLQQRSPSRARTVLPPARQTKPE